MDGIVYAIGGAVGTLTAGDMHRLRTVEAYDPKTDQWTRRADLPITPGWAAVGAVNGTNTVLATNQQIETTVAIPSADSKRFFRVLEAE